MFEWLRVQFIVKLGGYLEKGYPDAETAIEAVTDKKERRRLLTLAVKRCFNTIGPEDILHEKGGRWIAEGGPLSDAEIKTLVAQAAQLRRSLLWRILKADVKYQANKATFLKARTDDDLTAGKLCMWNFDVLETRLKSLGEESPHYNSEPAL